MSWAGARFNTAKQAAAIDRHAVRMIHEIGIKCPCRDEDVFATMTGDGLDAVARLDCTLCAGAGFIYREPQDVRGLFGGLSLQLTPMEFAWLQPGDAVFSAPPDGTTASCEWRAIGEWDRLTMTAPAALDGGQIIQRGSARRGLLVGLTETLTEDEDPLWYLPATARWCEDVDGNTYTQGTEFVLATDDRPALRWTGSRRPQEGTRYVLKYDAYLRWIVFAPPAGRWDLDWQDLGARVLLRKEHVVRAGRLRTSANSADAMARAP